MSTTATFFVILFVMPLQLTKSDRLTVYNIIDSRQPLFFVVPVIWMPLFHYAVIIFPTGLKRLSVPVRSRPCYNNARISTLVTGTLGTLLPKQFRRVKFRHFIYLPGHFFLDSESTIAIRRNCVWTPSVGLVYSCYLKACAACFSAETRNIQAA